MKRACKEAEEPALSIVSIKDVSVVVDARIEIRKIVKVVFIDES